eukprot:CAMPEP_0195284896 /NCGR_PEP_ID=MMETSP0707-20130614/2929_1 /TAXON_ID=33640 /ORGANISM="Asterionellopsis glacialis, Strain CCMP134" /LENGTH=73 /DNA_ID=CAMNT_0040344303 /DNA_START=351 /DNA_END=572 /DNA_ORIENTATION=+
MLSFLQFEEKSIAFLLQSSLSAVPLPEVQKLSQSHVASEGEEDIKEELDLEGEVEAPPEGIPDGEIDGTIEGL